MNLKNHTNQMFKVGDRVKVNDKCIKDGGSYYIGQIGKIIEIRDVELVKYNIKVKFKCGYSEFIDYELELVEDYKRNMKELYKTLKEPYII